jgi:hypothetical protein
MKNDFINWVLFGGVMVSDWFVVWPPCGLSWLRYVFFCLMGVFLLLIGKRSGRLTPKKTALVALVFFVGCILIYLISKLTDI